MESDDDDLVTESDIANLNRAAVERSASLARIAGNVLVVIGAVGVVGWAWVTVRTQDVAGPVQFGFGEELDTPDVFSRTASISSPRVWACC